MKKLILFVAITLCLLVVTLNNSIAQNVGIGTTNPTEKLEVAGNLLLNTGGPVLKFKKGAGVFSLSTIDFINSANVTNFRLQENNSSFILGRPASFVVENDLVIKTDNGNVGVNTASPDEKLHVNGNAMLGGTNPTLYLQNANVNKGFVQLNGDDIRMGTVSSNNTGNMVIRLNSSDHININPVGDLSMGLTSASPTIQLKNGGVDKGFVQLSGNNLRLGTNSGNTTGNVVIKMNGTDRVFVDELGRLGVGISNPTSRLHVSGNANITGDVDLTGNGIVVRPESGYKNLLPIAYGRVSETGVLLSGTTNVTITRAAEGKYDITCPQFSSTTTITVTLIRTSLPYVFDSPIFDSYSGSGTYRLNTYVSVGAKDCAFSFIAYE